MFGVMGTSAAFAQAACAKKAQEVGNIIRLIGVKEDPIIDQLYCSGEITVESIKNGEAVIQTYSDLSSTQVSIQADANTEVVIKGDVTAIVGGQYQGWGHVDSVMAKQLVFHNNAITSISGFSGKDNPDGTSIVESLDVIGCTALTSLKCYGCTGLTALDLSTNTALTSLRCHGCTGLTALDLSTNTALTSLECYGCTGLTALDLSTNTALTSLNCSDCTGLTKIKYHATNSDVSTAIAGAITDATAADGTVYTDSAGAYYSTIADAATAKGWTIEQLQ